MSALIVDEAMLREPRLWTPGMQPLGPVKVDWANPATQNLFVFAHENYAGWVIHRRTGNSFHSRVNEVFANDQYGTHAVPYRSGSGTTYGADIDYGINWQSTIGDFTHVFVGGFWLDLWSSNGLNLFLSSDSPSGTSFSIGVSYPSSSETRYVYATRGGYTDVGNIYCSFTEKIDFTVCALRSKSSIFSAWKRNEGKVNENSGTPITGYKMNFLTWNGGYALNCKQYAHMFFNEAISDSMILSLLDDPYQFLKPA